MAHQLPQLPIDPDPDTGVTDLVKQLADDSKRLVGDELRLAKMETAEGLHSAGQGALWIGIAFGIGVVALAALTLFLASAIGRAASGHYWVGAVVVALIELPIGVWLLKRGMRDYRRAPFTLPATRGGLRVIAKG